MKTMEYREIFALLAIGLVLSLSACGMEAQASTEETGIPTVMANIEVIVEGNLVPADSLAIPAAHAGRVGEILVEEGDIVQEGDVLIRFGDQESFEAVVTAAALELESAQQALDKLQENAPLGSSQAWLDAADAEQALIEAEIRWDTFEDSDFEDNLEEAEMDVIEAEDELETAREDLEQYQSLGEDNSLRTNAEDALEEAEQAYDDAIRARNLLLIQQEREKALLEQAQALYDDAVRAYDARLEGPDPDEISLLETRLENAQAQFAAAQAAMKNLEITAPMNATVVEVNITEGEQLMPGQIVTLLADFSNWYIETRDLTELEVVKIFEGQEVRIVPDSIPELELTGTVESIADVFVERLGDINYNVRIRLDETDPRLRWGMTAELTFAAE